MPTFQINFANGIDAPTGGSGGYGGDGGQGSDGSCSWERPGISATDGQPGGLGTKGGRGVDGGDAPHAPDLYLAFESITGRVSIERIGGKGGRGGGGGNGGGWGGWGGGGFGIVINPGPQRYYDNDRISCRTGKRIVHQSGYRRVRVIECRGNTYTYKGKRGSRVYRLSVDSLDGIIVSRRRL